MNKVEKIKAEIDRLQSSTLDENSNFKSQYDQGIFDGLSLIDNFIDSLEEEPISNDLEEAARKIATRHSHITGDTYYANDAWFFKKGAQWQKDHTCFAGRTKTIEEIKEALLSEVLPCFMHGGEADEVVAKLDEVLNKKKIRGINYEIK